MMEEFYPGSKQKVKNYSGTVDSASGIFSTHVDFSTPKIFTVGGREVEFFTIGDLARGLNRKPVTLRKWEAEGIIPKARAMAPSSDKRGKRRLYTKGQILGLVQIASEEGILQPTARGQWKSIEDTNFRTRAIQLFKELDIE